MSIWQMYVTYFPPRYINKIAKPVNKTSGIFIIRHNYNENFRSFCQHNYFMILFMNSISIFLYTLLFFMSQTRPSPLPPNGFQRALLQGGRLAGVRSSEHTGGVFRTSNTSWQCFSSQIQIISLCTPFGRRISFKIPIL